MPDLLTGEKVLDWWLISYIGLGAVVLVIGIATGFFKARKVQPKGFKWKQFRFEAVVAVVSLAFSGVVIGGAQK
ncbi:MAG: hypothetical protein ABI673_07235 [Novosphingobium sp.]